MAFALVYRLEFKNFEENTIRVDISDSLVPITPGGSLSIPNDVDFNTTGPINQIGILVYPGGFFYVGMTFTVSGSVSNDGTYTCTAILGTGTVAIYTAESFTNEYVSVGPVVFTDVSTTDPQIIPIQGTGTPLVISTINNEQDKFQPIRSKQAVIQIISDTTNGISSAAFTAGPDNKWIVDISIIGITPYVFRGFLIMSDNSQPFQPDPQTIQLTATDHLGTLKDLPLRNFDGTVPRGTYRVADLITMCLTRTGLLFDLFVVNNLRTGSGEFTIVAIFEAGPPSKITVSPTTFFYPGQTFVVTGTASNDGTYTVTTVEQGVLTIVFIVETFVDEGSISTTFTETASASHFYDIVRLDAKSYEAELGDTEDCYTVLSKILGKDCYICQWEGVWWVMRVDEFNGFPIYAAQFDPVGAFVTIAAGTAFDIAIGAAETRRFANADTLLQFIRPHGVARLEYPFELPLEIPDNVDFERGALISTVSAGEKHYDLDDWALLWSNTTSDDPSTIGITYLRRDFINDQEVKRYVVIEADPSGHLNFIMSNPIPVQALDKFTVDLSVRTSTNVGGSGSFTINAVQVRLYGNDGTYWTAHGKIDPSDLIPTWVLSDVTFRTSLGYFYQQGDLSTTDFTESQGLFSGEAAQIPVEGYLRILIFANPEDVTARATYIDKFDFNYIPFINGSYEKYSSDANQIDRVATGYMARYDEPVNTEDGPNRLTKGAMQITGLFTEIISDNIDFVSPNSMLIPGDVSISFYVGQIIRVAGTPSNDGIYLVTLVTYHTIPDNTEVGVFETISTETSAAGISVAAMTLTKNWYSAQPLALAINTDPTLVHSYGYIQIFSVWNQFRGSDNADGEGQGINIFSGSILGLTTSWPDLLHKYSITDVNQQSSNRYFMLLSMSQDWRSCIWTFVIAEVYDTVAGRNLSDDYSFKFIAE